MVPYMLRPLFHEYQGKFGNFFTWTGLVSVGMLCCPDSAHAIQTHGEPEGIVVHQLAHMVFLLAMVGMVLRIRYSSLNLRRSWRFFSAGAITLGVWNLWAFSGHQLEMLVSRSSIRVTHGQTPTLLLDSWVTFFYYIYKMDHCILVPAMVLFYLGMRQLIREDR
ncbi:MAG: hypothetical protein BWK76_19915 [Desulfobulbaceae bacterium A2]|nr:MAG: hypothetical protein BWK76_19915 [Desulfobulbaceae bacterium A2]